MKRQCRPHRVQHQKALKNVEVAESLTDLQRKWRTINSVQRASALQRLTESGCTLRGLASDLACSEGSLRWYLQIARLSGTERSAIVSGESAKRVLGDSKKRKAALARSEQLRQQDAINAISEQFKQLAIRWINEQELDDSYIELLLSVTDRRLWEAPVNNRTARQGNADVLWKFIESSKPKVEKPTYGPELLEYVIEWMVAWILLLVPERALHDLVIEKLKRHYARGQA